MSNKLPGKNWRNFIVLGLIIALSVIAIIITYLAFVLTQQDVDDRADASDINTVTVCASECDYIDINEAFIDAVDGQIIFLDTQEYSGNGVLGSLSPAVRNLTIKGRGKAQTSWMPTTTEGSQLKITGINGVKLIISDLNFTSNPFENNVIDIGMNNENNQFVIQNIQVIGNADRGLHVEGENTLEIFNSTFDQNKQNIRIRGEVQAKISKSIIIRSYETGVEVLGKANLQFNNNLVAGNANHGLEVREEATANVQNSIFDGLNAGETGLVFRDRSNGLITNSIIINNTRYGGIATEDFNGRVEAKYSAMFNNILRRRDGSTQIAHYVNRSDPEGRGPTGSTGMLFDVNPQLTEDYNLSGDSILIDAGDPEIRDLDGSISDIGIFGGPETVAGTIPQPSPQNSPTPSDDGTGGGSNCENSDEIGIYDLKSDCEISIEDFAEFVVLYKDKDIVIDYTGDGKVEIDDFSDFAKIYKEQN